MSQKPSILFINRVYPPTDGATGRLLCDLSKWFARCGWRVHVITTGDKQKKTSGNPVNIVRAGLSKKPRGVAGYLFIWIRLLLAGLMAQRCDVVVSMTDPPMTVVLGAILSKKMKARHIHWCQDVYPDLLEALDFPMPKPALSALQKWSTNAMSKCDRIIVIGRCMASRIAAKRIAANKITIIPNWPNITLSSKKTASEIRENEGRICAHIRSSEPKFRVLYAGNIGQVHDVRPILRAAKIIQEKQSDIEFVFVGGGKGFDEISKIRSSQGIENIKLLPHQPEKYLKALMTSGDVHLISLKASAFGLSVPCKLYSALAVSRPCVFIGPSQCEIARVINNFKTGAVIDPSDNGSALAEKILEYRHNGSDWFNAQNGASKAGKIFTPRASMRAFEARARSLLP